MRSMATAARAYAAQVLGLGVDRARSMSVHSIRGGERHHLFQVSVQRGESYVVRVNNTDDRYERDKARREAMVLSHLEDGLAPRLYDYDESATFFYQPVMLIAFLPGMHVDLATSNQDVLNSLGWTVGRLHDLEPSRFIAAFGLNARTPAEYLIERFKWDIGRRIQWDGLPGELATGFWKSYRKVAEAALDCVVQEEWLTPSPFSLLHGDIGGGNLIWSGGQVRLLDWEDVRLGDAAEEVAYVLTENTLSDRSRVAFWDGYADVRGARADTVAGRVTMWEPIVIFGSAMWWLDRYSRKLNALRTGMPEPIIPRALAYYRAQALQRLRQFEMCSKSRVRHDAESAGNSEDS